MLQPIDTAASERNKHKFMVQSMFAPPNFSSDQLDAVVRHLLLCEIDSFGGGGIGG